MNNPLHVLLVDDDLDVLNMMADLLERQGISTTKANNGEEALKLIENKSFNVVVTDIIMPVMDGLSLSRKLQGKLPVVLVSGHKDLDLDGKVEHLCVCFLEKAELKEKLAQATVKAYERFQIDKEIYLYSDGAA